MKTVSLTNSDKVALVDDADYAAVSRFSWALSDGYAIRYVPVSEHGERGKYRCQKMHIFLLGKRPGHDIDHKDGDPLNNQRSNLRHATKSQNNFNQRKTRGVSQYKGVYWHKIADKWHAQVCIDKRRIYLGLFTDESAAARAYDSAAVRYFGKFVRLNFPQLELQNTHEPRQIET